MVMTKVTVVAETVVCGCLDQAPSSRDVCQPVGKMASLSPSKGEEVEEDEENVFHPNREEEEIEGWEDFAIFKYKLECLMVPQLTRKAVVAERGMYSVGSVGASAERIFPSSGSSERSSSSLTLPMMSRGL